MSDLILLTESSYVSAVGDPLMCKIQYSARGSVGKVGAGLIRLSGCDDRIWKRVSPHSPQDA